MSYLEALIPEMTTLPYHYRKVLRKPYHDRVQDLLGHTLYDISERLNCTEVHTTVPRSRRLGTLSSPRQRKRPTPIEEFARFGAENMWEYPEIYSFLNRANKILFQRKYG